MLNLTKFIGFSFIKGFIIYFLGNLRFDKGIRDGNINKFYAYGTVVFADIIFISN